MTHYTVKELEAKIADWMMIGCIPLDGHEWLCRLVDRANSAEASQRDSERAWAEVARMQAEVQCPS